MVKSRIIDFFEVSVAQEYLMNLSETMSSDSDGEPESITFEEGKTSNLLETQLVKDAITSSKRKLQEKRASSHKQFCLQKLKKTYGDQTDYLEESMLSSLDELLRRKKLLQKSKLADNSDTIATVVVERETKNRRKTHKNRSCKVLTVDDLPQSNSMKNALAFKETMLHGKRIPRESITAIKKQKEKSAALLLSNKFRNNK